MIPLPPESVRIFIKPGRTDMRKSIGGLSAIVEGVFHMSPFEDGLFAFCNKRKEIIKLLWWDRNGFCIWHKRLEKGRFPWPDSEEEAMELTQEELGWLLNGIDFRNRHKRQEFTHVS